ncbi:MAG: hypothetical protein QMC54_08885, partial [Pseudomonadales bacterium]
LIACKTSLPPQKPTNNRWRIVDYRRRIVDLSYVVIKKNCYRVFRIKKQMLLGCGAYAVKQIQLNFFSKKVLFRRSEMKKGKGFPLL